MATGYINLKRKVISRLILGMMILKDLGCSFGKMGESTEGIGDYVTLMGMGNLFRKIRVNFRVFTKTGRRMEKESSLFKMGVSLKGYMKIIKEMGKEFVIFRMELK